MANNRPTAAEATAVERRRRAPGTLTRLDVRRGAVSEEVKAANEGYHFRWCNDVDNRIYQLTKLDDWDRVDGIEPQPCDTDKFGKPVMRILLKKKKEYYDKDKADELDVIKDRETRSLQQAKIDPEDKRPDELAYVAPGNSISTGYKP